MSIAIPALALLALAAPASAQDPAVEGRQEASSAPDPVQVERRARLRERMRARQVERLAEERARRAADAPARRAALARVNERLAASPVAWLDGHCTGMHRVRLTADGARAATLSIDGSAWLWDAWTGEAIGMLGIHERTIMALGGRAGTTLRFSADGERVLIHDPASGVAELWDGRSAERLVTLAVGDEVVCAAAFGPRGGRVATADAAGAVRLFDAASGARSAVPAIEAGAVDELSFDPGGGRLLTLARYGTARVWDAETGAEIAELGSPELFVTWARFSADGERVLGESGSDVALSWDLADPSRPLVLRSPGAPWSAVDWGTGGDLAGILGLLDLPQVRPVGRRLFVVEGDGTVSLWDGSSGAEVSDLEGLEPALTSRSTERLPTWIAFSPDGDRLVTLSGEAGQLWDGDTGERIADLSGAEGPFHGELAVFSPSGRCLAVADLNQVSFPKIYDGRTGELTRALAPFRGDGFNLHFDANERLASVTGVHYVSVWDGAGTPPVLLSGRLGQLDSLGGRHLSPVGSLVTSFGHSTGDDRSGPRSFSRLWRLDTGFPAEQPIPEARAVNGFEGCVLAREGTELLRIQTAYDHFDGRREGGRVAVERFDPRSGARLGAVVLDELSSPPVLVAPGPEVDRVLILGQWFHADLWDLTDGRRVADLGSVRSQPFATTVDAELARLGAVSPAGRLAALAAEEVLLYDGRTGEDVGRLSGFVRDLAFSPDGSLLAGASWSGSVLLWSVADRALLGELEGHEGPARFVAFDPGGTRIVSSGQDGTARVWDVATREPVAALRAHGGFLNHSVFAPDGRRVLTAGSDGTAWIWDAASGETLATLEGHVAEVTHVEFSAEGSRILTEARDATARVWDGDSGRLLATRVEYSDGWLIFVPSGHYAAGGGAAERARVVVHGRRTPLSSYAAVYESPEKVAASLAGEQVRPPSFVPRAPELRIAAPLEAVVRERAFRLEVLLEDTYGIEGVTVEQDGVELDAAWVARHLEVATGGRSARLSCEIAVPEGASATTVHVRARNVREILSAVDTVHVRYEAPQRELYLLALGVADYADDALDLAYPTKDADDLIARFRAEEGGFYSKVNVRRLADGEVTPGRLRRAREEFLLHAEPEDTIVVFAAGHGVRSASGEYYFLTPSTTPDDPYDGIERAVLESLVTWDRLHASRRILLLDTCHSGEAFGEGKRGVALDSFDQAEVDEAAGTGLYIIAASSEAGFAQETEGNGLFTRALLEGLDGAADADGDGLVGIDELKTFATTAVHERSGGRQRPTAPRIEGGEDFPLARRR